jgi:hypothetical protein
MASAVVLECTAVSGMMLMRAGQQSRVFATSSTTTTISKQKMDLRCNNQQQSLLSKLSLSNAEMIPVVWRRTDSRTRAVATSAFSASASSSSPVAVASGAPSGMSILLTSNLQSKPIPYGLEAHAWAATLRGLGKMMKRLLTEEMPNVALVKLRFLYMKELAFLL